MRSGIKTTEFWLSLAAAIVGGLMTSGMFADGSTAMRIAGVAAMALAAVGYSTSRSGTKAAHAPSPFVQTAGGDIVNPPPPPGGAA